jgi:hypothetical protein
MKKIVSRILAVSMAAVMALSLASCGSNEKEGKDDVVSNESQVEASKVESDAGFQTIEEYLASDEIQSQLDTIRDSMSNDEVTVDIAAEGNKLIYICTYTEQIEAEGLAEQFESALDEKASAFGSMAQSLGAQIGVDSPTVEVRYLNADGSEIYTREFAAE